MTKNEALYKYLKMDYRFNDNYEVLSYDRVEWSFICMEGSYHLKTGRTPYYPCKITERVILKLVKLL